MPSSIARSGDHGVDLSQASAEQCLPLTSLVPLPRAGSMLYSLARVDSQGTVSAGLLAKDLGWRREDHLVFAVIPSSQTSSGTEPEVLASVLVRRHATGTCRISRRGYLVLPSAVRRRCGIAVNDHVLLAADPTVDVVMIHPVSAVDAMIGEYHAGLLRGSTGD